MPIVDASATTDISLPSDAHSEVDGACEPPRSACSMACVDLQSDPRHCGRCDNACQSPTGTEALCQFGRCRVTCRAGYFPSSTGCLLEAPAQPLYPSNFVRVSTRRPRFIWRPGSTARVRLELCSDPSCRTIFFNQEFSFESSFVPSEPLSPGHVFWRLRSLRDDSTILESALNHFIVSSESSPHDLQESVYFDANGDGIGDLVYGEPEESRVTIRLGQTTGIAQQELSIPGPINSQFGRYFQPIGDVDRDGFGDLAILLPHRATVYIWHGSAQLSTEALSIVYQGESNEVGTALSTAGDFNRDGFGDFAVSTRQALVLFSGERTRQPLLVNRLEQFQGIANLLGGGDFEGDQFSDLWLQGNDGRITLLPGHPVNTPFTAHSTPLNVALREMYFRDVDHDGISDAIVPTISGYYAGNAIRAFTFTSLPDLRPPLIMGDFRNDGYLDFATLLNTSSDLQVTVYSGNNASPRFQTERLTSPWPNARFAGRHCQDFTGDGRDDLLLLDEGANAVLYTASSAANAQMLRVSVGAIYP